MIKGEMMTKGALKSWASVIVLIMAMYSTTLAGPGDGITANDLTLSPYLEVKGISDSNVRVTRDDEIDDLSFMGTAGLTLLNASGVIRLNADLWGRLQSYQDLTEEDHEDFGDDITISLGNRDQLLLTVDQLYRNIEEIDYGTGSLEDRENIIAGVSIGKNLTDKLEVEISGRFESTEYEAERLFDWDESAVGLEVAHALTDKTSTTIAGKIGTQSSDANVSDADFVSVHAGLKTRQTAKVIAKVGLGFHSHDIGDDDDISLFSFDAGISWQVNDRFIVHVSGNNGVEPATQDLENYRIVSRAIAGATWQADDTLSVSLSGRYIQNDYEKNVTRAGGSGEAKDDTSGVSLRLTYSPPAGFMDLFVEGKVETRDSTIDLESYDQTKATVGMKLIY